MAPQNAGQRETEEGTSPRANQRSVRSRPWISLSAAPWLWWSSIELLLPGRLSQPSGSSPLLFFIFKAQFHNTPKRILTLYQTWSNNQTKVFTLRDVFKIDPSKVRTTASLRLLSKRLRMGARYDGSQLTYPTPEPKLVQNGKLDAMSKDQKTSLYRALRAPALR